MSDVNVTYRALIVGEYWGSIRRTEYGGPKNGGGPRAGLEFL